MPSLVHFLLVYYPHIKTTPLRAGSSLLGLAAAELRLRCRLGLLLRFADSRGAGDGSLAEVRAVTVLSSLVGDSDVGPIKQVYQRPLVFHIISNTLTIILRLGGSL
jgi:hypothetical protein